MFTSNKLGFITLSVPEGINVENYVSMLRSRDEFEFVEYDVLFEYCFTPNDTSISSQWYLNRINAFNIWYYTMGNRNIKVAIIDSGVDWAHPDIGYGECNRWYIWPTAGKADVSVYLDPWHTGGSLRVECKIYTGNTIVNTVFFYLDVTR